MLAVALRIADEIGKAALERIGPQRDDRIAAKSDLGIKARPLRIEPEVLQKFRDVDFRRAFAGVAPREGEIGLEHALHFIDVFLQFARLVGLASSRRAKA